MVSRRGLGACVLSFLLLLGPASQSLAEEPASSLQYALPDQSIWTTHTTSAGVPDNPLVKYAANLFAKAGLAYHVATYPSARLFNMLKEEPGVFSMLVESPTVRACCLISSHPVAHTDLMAYRLDGSPALKGPEDLKGRHLILIRGYTMASWRRSSRPPIATCRSTLPPPTTPALPCWSADEEIICWTTPALPPKSS